jgi:hypothetical protein
MRICTDVRDDETVMESLKIFPLLYLTFPYVYSFVMIGNWIMTNGL